MSAPHDVVAALLVEEGRVLVVLRAADRRWYPGVWDLPGGHVEPGEAPAAALTRELREELGVDVEPDGHPHLRLDGDGFRLAVWVLRRWRGRPTNLAPDEHDELRFVDMDGLAALPLAHPHLGDMVRRAIGPPRVHVMAFLPAGTAGPVEALRRTGDPGMAAMVGAHVTVAYPEEAPDPTALAERVRALAATTSPFPLALGAPAAFTEERAGAGLNVDDPAGGLAALRRQLLRPPFRDLGYPAHVTLAHPRTTPDGCAAFAAAQAAALTGPWTVREIALTATLLDRVDVLERFALEGSALGAQPADLR